MKKFLQKLARMILKRKCACTMPPLRFAKSAVRRDGQGGVGYDGGGRRRVPVCQGSENTPLRRECGGFARRPLRGNGSAFGAAVREVCGERSGSLAQSAKMQRVADIKRDVFFREERKDVLCASGADVLDEMIENLSFLRGLNVAEREGGRDADVSEGR